MWKPVVFFTQFNIFPRIQNSQISQFLEKKLLCGYKTTHNVHVNVSCGLVKLKICIQWKTEVHRFFTFLQHLCPKTTCFSIKQRCWVPHSRWKPVVLLQKSTHLIFQQFYNYRENQMTVLMSKFKFSHNSTTKSENLWSPLITNQQTP